VRFYEYEAKALFARHGIPLLKGKVVKSAAEARDATAEIGGPVVLKSQVLTGGRMKAGGVKFADDPATAGQHAEAILALQKAIGLNDDPNAHRYLAEAYRAVGRADDSRAETLLYQQMVERAKAERLKTIRGTP